MAGKSVDPTRAARLVKKLQRESSVVSLVRSEEWDFARCKPKHRTFCRIYEYGRESEDCKKKVREWRDSDTWIESEPGEGMILMDDIRLSDLARRFPEFPSKAWLDFSATELDRRIKTLPSRKIAALRGIDSQGLRTEIPRKVDLDLYRSQTIETIEVNWWCSDAEILEAFRGWLLEKRPEKHAEKRGRTSDSELLNALAAKRLLAKHTVADAGEISSRERGNPLFKTQSEWSRARQIAEDHLLPNGHFHPAADLLVLAWQCGVVGRDSLCLQFVLSNTALEECRRIRRMHSAKMVETLNCMIEKGRLYMASLSPEETLRLWIKLIEDVDANIKKSF